MQPDGSIAEVLERGRDFLRGYIGRLSSYSPVFPPGLPDAAPLRPPMQGGQAALGIREDGVVKVDSPLELLGRAKEAHKDDFPWDEFILPANMALPCNYSRSFIQKARKSRGCPFAGRSVYQVTAPARVAA